MVLHAFHDKTVACLGIVAAMRPDFGMKDGENVQDNVQEMSKRCPREIACDFTLYTLQFLCAILALFH